MNIYFDYVRFCFQFICDYFSNFYLLFLVQLERLLSWILQKLDLPNCSYKILGTCFHTINSNKEIKSIFGFAEYMAALALLVVVYTTSDFRYKFRISIAPIPLYKITYFVIALVGFGTLAIDVWIASDWLIPETSITAVEIQGLLALFFLTTFIFWIFFAFIKPATFGKLNARRFASEFYRILLRGSEEELSILSYELIRSATSIVRHANPINLKENTTFYYKWKQKNKIFQI